MSSEMSRVHQSAGAEPEQTPQNHISRLVGLWFSPGEAFADIARVPKVLIPTLLLILLPAASNYLLLERYGYENYVRETIRELVNAGQLGQEMAEDAFQQSMSPQVVAGSKFQFSALPTITVLLTVLTLAGIFKILGSMTGAQCGFRRIYSITAYAFLAISSAHTVVLLLLIYLKDPITLDLSNPIASNLGALLPMMTEGLPKYALRLSSYLDVFVFWRLIILAIGYGVALPKVKTGTAAGLLALLNIIAAVIVAIVASQFE